MSIILYNENRSPPCRAVLMTAKQLNIKVNIIPIEVLKGEHLTPEYLKLNPGHTVPTIVDGDFVLYESRAIMQYLCNKYAPDNDIYPKEPEKRAVVDRWLNTDFTYFMASRDIMIGQFVYGGEPTQQMIDTFKKMVQMMNTLVADKKYLAGDHLTIADLSVLATTTLLTINDNKGFDDCPHLKRWFDGLRSELPYYEEINGSITQEFKEAAKLKVLAHKFVKK